MTSLHTISAVLVHAAPSIANYTGQTFFDWVLTIIGNALIVAMVIFAVRAWGTKQWGEFIGIFVGGIVIGGFVWFPDQALAVLKAIWTAIFGG